MPAVTYYQAQQTMHEHGDAIIEYLVDAYDEEFQPPPTCNYWGGICCFCVSAAVELWCSCHEDLADWENDESINDLQEIET